MSSIRSQSVGRLANGIREVRLVNWPLRDEAPCSWLLVLLALVSAYIVRLVADSWPLAVASLLALLVCFWRLWLPVTFELGPRGVTQVIAGVRLRTSWTEFARYRLHSRGVMLLVDADDRPLGFLRGLFIRSGNQHEALVSVVERFIRGSRRSDSSIT